MANYDSNRLPVDRKLLARIFSKIKISTEHFYKGVPCWEWTAAISNNGYGTIGVSRKRKETTLAHRMAYQLFVEILPDDLHCDHLCRVRHCVNPAHIEPVTNRENILRGAGMGARHFRKTHCIHGHEYSATNTSVKLRSDGYAVRVCRECGRQYMRRKRAAKNLPIK